VSPKNILVMISTSACMSALAADGDEALFGLRWGMTPAEVRAIDVTLTKSKGDRNLEIYRTTSLPRNVSDTESYSLMFADGRLVKLWAVGKNIVNDPTGSNGKERFEALRSALTEKYGKPTSNAQTTGNKLYRESDEFYQCLAYSGCGVWASIYETSEKVVSVELKGMSRGTGFLDITAEAKPQFERALEIYKTRKNKSDKDAL
jgi:hypothetical protein